MGSDFSQLGGWLGVDAVQQAFAAQYRRLRDASPNLYGADWPSRGKEPILLYKSWRDVLGDYPAYVAQQIGDCVGQGHGRGADLLQAVEIALGEPSEYREVSTEFVYATGREVGNILGRQDGSYGSITVRAMTTIGLVSREMVGTNGAYSGNRAKEWGLRGAPQSLKTAAADFKLGSAALVKTWGELVAAIGNGYPVTICSNQGFSLQRDAQGFCQARGTWAHCMLIGGVRFDRPGACILQSWGSNNPTGPRDLDQPSFSFWADRPVVERILAQGDSWALSKAPEFVSRPLPAHWSYDSAA